MGNKGKKLNRLYDKGTKQWFDVPADFFEKYDKERDAFRKKMQDHGRCVCPFRKDWLCDMMCDDCEFQRAGDYLSLDAPEGDGNVSLLDEQEAEGPRMEDVVADRDLLNRLIVRLHEIDPDADQILALWQENDRISDRAMAEALGYKQRTFADKMKRIRTELRKVRGY